MGDGQGGVPAVTLSQDQSTACCLSGNTPSSQMCIGVCSQLQEIVRTCCVVMIALPPPKLSSSCDVWCVALRVENTSPVLYWMHSIRRDCECECVCVCDDGGPKERKK